MYASVKKKKERKVVTIVGLGLHLDLITEPLVVFNRTLTLSLLRLMERETPPKICLKAVTGVVSF